jgi:hypothetical protein
MLAMGIRSIRVVLAASTLAALAACASSPGSASSGPVVTATVTATATTTATATATATVTATPKAASRPAYDAAKSQWKQGATAISADQGKYWTKAASQLTAGASTDGGDTSGYLAAAAALTELTSLPDAMQTPAQNATYHADIDALNAFFHTPGLYG